MTLTPVDAALTNLLLYSYMGSMDLRSGRPLLHVSNISPNNSIIVGGRGRWRAA